MKSYQWFCLSIKRKSGIASVNMDSQWSKKESCLHVRPRCDSLPITTPVSPLAYKFDVRRVLHGQVSLAAVNQFHVFCEAINGCKNLKMQ